MGSTKYPLIFNIYIYINLKKNILKKTVNNFFSPLYFHLILSNKCPCSDNPGTAERGSFVYWHPSSLVSQLRLLSPPLKFLSEIGRSKNVCNHSISWPWLFHLPEQPPLLLEIFFFSYQIITLPSFSRCRRSISGQPDDNIRCWYRWRPKSTSTSSAGASGWQEVMELPQVRYHWNSHRQRRHRWIRF